MISGVIAGVVLVGVGLAATGKSGTVVPKHDVSSAAPRPNYARLLAPAAPGFQALSDHAPGAGPATEDSIVANATNKDAVRNGLRNSGFVDGYLRAFGNANNTSGYYVKLYRLADASGAAHYESLSLKANTSDGAVVRDTSSGATIVTPREQDSAHNWSQLSITRKGDYVVVVRFWSHEPLTSTSRTISTTRSQLARLS